MKEQEINIIDRNSLACDKKHYDEVHSKHKGEPIASVDFRLYRDVLTEEAGISPQTARECEKALRKRYFTSPPEVRRGIAATLAAALSGLSPRREPMPVTIQPTETMVYRR